MAKKIKAVLVSKDADFLNFFFCTQGQEDEEFEAIGSPYMDEENLISFIREHNPDIVLLDVGMPAMDGIGLSLTIRKAKRLGKLPIMLFSTFEAPVGMIKGYGPTPADSRHFSTPIDLEEVIKMIKEQLQKNAAAKARA